MQRTTAAVVIAVVAGCLAACTWGSAPSDRSSSASAGTPSAASSAGISTRIKVATLGEAVEVQGPSEGSALTVTAVRTVPTERVTDEWDSRGPLNVYVQVQFKIVNTGTVTYHGSPNLSAKLIGSRDIYSAANWSPLSGAEPATPITLAPSEQAEGLVIFEIPRGTKSMRVSFSMDEAADFKQFKNDPFPLPAEWDLTAAGVTS